MNSVSHIKETADFIRSKTSILPRVGVVLGTGLNELVNHIDINEILPYSEIPHFPVPTVAFHKGKLLFGSAGPVPVVMMQGRFHYYEGYSMQEITFPVRVMKELGIEYLLLSNAAGGLNPEFKKGDLIITEDHINLLPGNPLRGLGEEFGNRFVDMSAPYSQPLQHLMENSLTAENVAIKKGIYVSVMGPNLETRAEYRWLRSMGADMVGMSTVPEVIVANQLHIACASVSVITDECDPDNLQAVNISEIIHTAQQADLTLSKIFLKTLGQL